MNSERRPWFTAPRFTPLLGILLGALGGCTYWLGAQVWPTSVAVIMAMVIMELLSSKSPLGLTEDAAAPAAAHAAHASAMHVVLMALVKYNALMALSAANTPFTLPGNVALGFIMIAGQACSRALIVSNPVSPSDLGIALLLGFAPAAFIGLPGLIGLAAAIAARLAIAAYGRRTRPTSTAPGLAMTQQLIEVCFYLGALGAWAYA